jgi:hypothetical protein
MKEKGNHPGSHWEELTEINWAGRGRPEKYDSPVALWAAAVSYFRWVKDHPIIVEEIIPYQGQANTNETKRYRPMTKQALCIHLGITTATWYDWKARRPDLEDVIDLIESVIWTNKLEGAAANLFNSAVIIREMGLRENMNVEQASESKSKIDVDMTGIPTDAIMEVLKGIRAGNEPSSSSDN